MESAGDDETVVEAGDGDEGGDGESQVVEKQVEASVWIGGGQDGEKNHANFEEGGGLAEQARGERHVTLDEENDGCNDEHEDIATDDHDGEPPGNFLFHGERDEGEGKQ